MILSMPCSMLATSVKSVKAQMDGMSKMTTAMLTKSNDSSELNKLLVVALPAVLPIIQEWMGRSDPSKQAELMSVMGDNSLQNLSMIQQFIQGFAEQQPDTPPWFPVVQEALNGLIRVTEQMTRMARVP